MTKYTDEASAVKTALDSTYVSYDDIILFADTVINTLNPYKIYNVKFDGTEDFTTHTGTITATNGILTGDGACYGHLTEYYLNNDELWEVSFKAKATGNGANIVLTEEDKTTSKQYELLLNADGGVEIYHNSYKDYNASMGTGFNSNDWVNVSIKKTNQNTLEITIGSTTNTYTWITTGLLLNLNFGVYNTANKVEVKDLVIKTDLTTYNYSETIYQPPLDGTDTIDLADDCHTGNGVMYGYSGVLADGFTNTQHWKLTGKLQGAGDYPDHAILRLVKKESPITTTYRWNIRGDSHINCLIDSTVQWVKDGYPYGFSTDYQDFSIERVGENYLKIKIGDNTMKAYWDSLNNCTEICYAHSYLVRNGYIRTKELTVKAPVGEGV